MVFPGTMFGDDSTDYIRISYLQPLPIIKEAMERIRGFIAEHKAKPACTATPDPAEKFVGIQVSPISFLDEGVSTSSTRSRRVSASTC